MKDLFMKIRFKCFWNPPRPKRKVLLFPEMRVTRKMFTRAAANLFFQSILLNFLNKVYTKKNYSNSTFLCWKTRSPTFYFSKSRKRQFFWTNLTVENRLKSKFYSPNFFHWRCKIQALTWTFHCRSQNLQPASTS